MIRRWPWPFALRTEVARPSRATPTIAALVGALALAGLAALASSARAEVVRKGEDAGKQGEGPGKPGEVAEKPAGETEEPAPGKRARPESPEDRERLEALRLRLLEWTENRVVQRLEGLEVRAMLAPDAITYQATLRYLRLRDEGKGHDQAVEALAALLPRWKRLRDRVLLEVTLANPDHRRSKDERRIFTLQESLGRKALVVTDSRGRRLRLGLAGRPSGLRSARVRVKKFWVTADGWTRRTFRPRDPSRADPASIGRKPLISKPTPALVLEATPARIDCLLSRTQVRRTGDRRFRVLVRHLKRYEGPFADDIVDLNLDRPWKEIGEVKVSPTLPPAGLEVPPAMARLLEEISARPKR